MTKDVELHSDKWSKMTSALSSVTEHSTSTGSGYGNYSNQFSGDYGFSSASKGFSKRIEPLETISERVQQLISEKDSDGVVSYSYHQMRSRAQELESKLSILENYSSNVPTYIKTKIDEPFYKAMDKVGEKLEALNIQKYKIPNTVGYKQVEPIKDDYQRVVGTKEVMPEEISINELYKLKNPYQLALQQSYSNYQNSKDYKEHPLTQEEYLTMMLNTRHFEYVSIDDEKSSIEMWRDFVIGAGIVALYIFCPPAGAVTNTIFAGLELSSAVSGKDWGTGRELDNGERALRGVFALIDLKEVGGLAKVAAKAGFAGVKMSLKTSFKEGMEQGAKNVDNFKGLWTGIKTYGDNFIHSIPEYSRQLTNQVKNFADEKVLNFSKVAQEGVERAKNFSLEIPTVGVVEDTFGGRQMMFTTTSKNLGDTSLGKGLDYIGSKANQVENGSLARLRARNAFYATKDEWMSVMKESDIVLNSDLHSKIEILKQRGIIVKVDDGTIELVNNMRKGNIGEMSMDEIYRQLGYERISLDMVTDIDGVTHHGIDGVYYNPNGHPPYIIAEAKYGGARLSYLRDGTKQMSNPWISDRLKDAVGVRNFEIIDEAMKRGDVGYQLVNIKKNGNIMINNLDKNAKIIRP